MNELTHISLFTGIGGFDLAAEWAGFRTIAMCEIDPFCQEVLKARFGAVADARDEGLPGSEWPGAHSESGTPAHRPTTERHPLLIPDIRDFDGAHFRGATLLTGGFPCQPFSHAGKREGRNDKQGRHLWPEMLQVIAESRPRWCIAENVPGLISIEDGVVFEQACTDLEGEGYEVQAFIIPACAVNAPHRRDRVWICAHNTQDALDGGNGGRRDGDTPRLRRTLQTARPDSDAPDAESGQSRLAPQQEGREDTRGGSSEIAGWDIPWIEVASALCDVSYGLPADLDRYRDRWDKKVDRQKEKEFIYEDPDAPWFGKRYKGNNPYAYWRTKSLQAGGNAIVPQVAYQIIKEIAEIEG